MSDHRHHVPQGESPGQAYFDMGESEPDVKAVKSGASEGSNVPLTWRGDPKETFSDCTIVVVTNELETVTYHVHTSVLCFGTRRSRYFARLVANRTPKEKLSGVVPTVKVELDQRDAANFTILLDYLYAPCSYLNLGQATMETATLTSTITSPSIPFVASSSSEDEPSYLALGEDINTENAVSLRHLSKLFEMDSLMLAVNKFIQKDLNFKTGPVYLVKASEHKDDRLLESARRLCADNFEQLDKRALNKLPPHLFRMVVQSLETRDDDDPTLSLFLSEVVCRHLEKHKAELSAELLLDCTDPVLMPQMASEAAIGFTALVKSLDPEDARRHWDPLVHFCHRCARVVVNEYGWNEFSVRGAVDEYLTNCRESTSQISHVDSLLFSTSFAAALEQAQNDYEQVADAQTAVEGVVETLQRSVSILEKTHTLKDEYVAKQQVELEEAWQQIEDLKEELAEAKRKQHQRKKRRPPQRPPSHDPEQMASCGLPPSMQPQRIMGRGGGGGSRPRPAKTTTQSSPTNASVTSDLSSALFQDPAIRDLVSPSSIGTDRHINKSQKMKELQSKTEMRSRSLLL